MRIAIAGAGAVGQSIAHELLDKDHQVLLIERYPQNYRTNDVPGADWLLADACELSSLEDAGIDSCDVVVAATGDDKVNLVFALLAKTEFAVRRVVARINEPRNEWLFTDAWGVDVAISTPRMIVAAVEEAVSVGDLVRLLTLHEGQHDIVTITLPLNTPIAGRRVRDLALPSEAVLITIMRGGRMLAPVSDSPLAGGDEMLFVTTSDVENAIRDILHGRPKRS